MGTYVQPTTPKTQTQKRQPLNQTPKRKTLDPTEKPCVKKIYGQSMSVGLNEIYYGYLHVKSGFVWLTM